MEEKEAKLREVRKLLMILNRFGNILVPGYGNLRQVFAQDKLSYCVAVLKEKYNMEIRHIEEEMAILK